MTREHTGSFKRRRAVSSALLVLVSVVGGTTELCAAFSQPDGKKQVGSLRRLKAITVNEPTRRSRTAPSVGAVASPFEATLPTVSAKTVSPRGRRTAPSELASDQPPYLVSIPASSKVVTVTATKNKSTHMVRPKSRTSSPRLDGRMTTTVTRKNKSEKLLTREEEGLLTYRIRSLRRAVRIRDDLAEKSEGVPSEMDWALACNLSVIGLRRVMYEGQQARTKLVDANVGLVRWIAKRYHRALRESTEAGDGVGTILGLQDLIQEGNLGLMQAAERFERERGLRFSTYATYWIRQRILQSISDSSRIIRLPAHGEFSLPVSRSF